MRISHRSVTGVFSAPSMLDWARPGPGLGWSLEGLSNMVCVFQGFPSGERNAMKKALD